MIKQVTAAAIATFAMVAWIGIFFPPTIAGTPTRAETYRVETLCYSDCPGKFNGKRQVENG